MFDFSSECRILVEKAAALLAPDGPFVDLDQPAGAAQYRVDSSAFGVCEHDKERFIGALYEALPEMMRALRSVLCGGALYRLSHPDGVDVACSFKGVRLLVVWDTYSGIYLARFDVCEGRNLNA